MPPGDQEAEQQRRQNVVVVVVVSLPVSVCCGRRTSFVP